MKKLLIVTDAWHPQVSGVVRVTETLKTILEGRGFEVHIIDPSQFAGFTLPRYADIRLALFPYRRLAHAIDTIKPDMIHVMTEGPLGFAARRYCLRSGVRFTSWYHTHFDNYINIYFPGILKVVTAVERWFHNVSEHTFVSTKSLEQVLVGRGFTNLAVVPLGVDTERFVHVEAPKTKPLEAPVFGYFSRLAPEKSPDEFFKLKLPGTKLVIGDGPERARLEKKYGKQNGGDAVFIGYKKGQELVEYLSMCDVMIFPSCTETFGLVILEALACGVPVAAHNVMGPRDIITEGKDGYLGDDLKEAALKCLKLNKEDCRQKALQYSWEHSADEFVSHLVPVK